MSKRERICSFHYDEANRKYGAEPYEIGDELVRCKECDMSEVYQSDSSGVMARYCKAFTPTRMVADDDFCSYGERREP